MRKMLFASIPFLMILLFTPSGGIAQVIPNGPDGPITIVVNAGAGGPIDILGRTIRDGVSNALGQPVVVENRVGAGGMLGATSVARAAPDGRTLLLVATNSVVYVPLMNKNTPYDPVKDLAPISHLGEVPVVMVMSAAVPAKTFGEFVALAKANPGKYSFASSGVGTSPHLAGELLKSLAGIDLLHVPYRSGPDALAAVLGGNTTICFSGPSLVRGLADQGKVRLLTHTGTYPTAGIPSSDDVGLPGFKVPNWFGLFAPKETPRPVIDAINAAVQRTLSDPATKALLDKNGYKIVDDGPDQLAKLLQSDLDRWRKIIADAKNSGSITSINRCLSAREDRRHHGTSASAGVSIFKAVSVIPHIA